MARVDTRDFQQLEKQTNPIIKEGEKEHNEYLLANDNPKESDSEYIVLKTLDAVADEIKEWFINRYGFSRDNLKKFPPLEKLLWHENNWTLRKAIDKHYHDYRTKHCNKARLAADINAIIDNESIRLRNTVFDSNNEIERRYNHVLIGGANACGGCGDYYGEFTVGLSDYILPPYHNKCQCYAVYYD